jgi:NAD(P) transhydrogenase subunit beta
MTAIIIRLTYLVAAVFFIVGLKRMSHPRSAALGNVLSAVGMLLAVLATLADSRIVGVGLIFLGLAVGTGIGALLAQRVQMTAMPQMVALLNGFGGGASVLVAGAELARNAPRSEDVTLAIALSGLVGAVTFSGSLIAYGKLQEIDWFNQPLPLSGDQRVNAGLGIVLLLLIFWMTQVAGGALPYSLVVLVALVLGVLLVMPIGGADMPVVIALLNSYSGIAAAATGFVINNDVLIIAGSLVGASGIILTQIMCRGMNRSLGNVLFGKLSLGSSEGADELYTNVRRSSPEFFGMLVV